MRVSVRVLTEAGLLVRRGRVLCVVAIAALVTTAGTAAGQTTPPAASCDSVVRAARVDTATVTARAYLLRRDGGVLSTRARNLVMESILGHFAAPKPLVVPVFSAGPMRTRMLRPESAGDSLTRRTPILYGVYYFTLYRYGWMGPVATAVATLSSGFDGSVVAAISATARDSMLMLVPRALDVDSVALELRITTGPEDPRVRVPPVTLFTATFPVVRLVDARPAGVLPLAPYPEEERDEGVDGEVVLRTVVDVNGAAVVPTLEVQHATSPAFALSAAQTLARYHFTPAHVDGCFVPQVVEVPFWFSLRP